MNNLFRAITYQWNHLFLKFMVSLAAFIVVIFVFYFLSSLYGFSFSELTTNPYSHKDLPVYAGILQKIGMVLWIASSVVCFFIVYVGKDKQKFFLYAGLISSLFALDELILLHNKFIPTIYKLNQNLIYIIYGILIVIFIVKHRDRVFRSEFLILYTSLFFLLLKILIDGFQNMGVIADTKESYIEDSAKLLGIFFWFYYFLRFAYYKIRDKRRFLDESGNGKSKQEQTFELKKEKGG